MRFHHTCNFCSRINLNHSWTCFSCHYDLCLTCYDSDNTKPTKLKECYKGHLLIYTDKKTRPNVICNKCCNTNFLNQYSCMICDYDECMNCYEKQTI